MLRSFAALDHRGTAPSRMGAALHAALRARPGPEDAAEESEEHIPAYAGSEPEQEEEEEEDLPADLGVFEEVVVDDALDVEAGAAAGDDAEARGTHAAPSHSAFLPPGTFPATGPHAPLPPLPEFSAPGHRQSLDAERHSTASVSPSSEISSSRAELPAAASAVPTPTGPPPSDGESFQ